MLNEFHIHCQRRIWSDDIALFVGKELGERLYVAGPAVMHQVERGEALRDPLLELKVEDAQRLMDELWQCGIRPNRMHEASTNVAAIERHLNDMRALAFAGARNAGLDVQRETK